MTIYKNTVADILYELNHRDEVMKANNFDQSMYYAYMCGRMEPILNMLMKANTIIEIKGGSKWK